MYTGHQPAPSQCPALPQPRAYIKAVGPVWPPEDVPWAALGQSRGLFVQRHPPFTTLIRYLYSCHELIRNIHTHAEKTESTEGFAYFADVME